MTDDRVDWDTYFMEMAYVVAKRGTCPRKQVGAVLVGRNNRVITTGYNGAPRGLPHCIDIGCEMRQVGPKESCVRVLHAESNVFNYAGYLCEGGVLYVTVAPCYECTKQAINVGIVRIVYHEWYQSKNTNLSAKLLSEAQVSLEQWDHPSPAAGLLS